MQTSRHGDRIWGAGFVSRSVRVWLGLLVLLAGCQDSGTQGRLAPQAEPAPAVTRQAVDNLLSLYQTALRQAAAETVADVAALRATLSTTFRRRTVTALAISADSLQVAADSRTLTFLEVESTEDPVTLAQQTCLFRAIWGLVQDTVAGTPLNITANGDDGIDTEADAIAAIKHTNIIFAGNADRDIEGSFHEVATEH